MPRYKVDSTTGELIPIYPDDTVMSGASASSDGRSGYVPQPKAGDQGKALAGDASWKGVRDLLGGPLEVGYGGTGATTILGALASMGNPQRGFYGTCATAGDVAAKVATVSDANFKLVVGVRVTLKFTNANTASNPTLNVNGTGAKSIYYNVSVLTTSNLIRAGAANVNINYVYDGTYWVFMSSGYDNNTWTALAGASSSADGTAGYAPKPTKGQQDYILRGNGTWSAPLTMKSVLGIGSTAMNFGVSNPSSSSQALHLVWTDCNANSAYNGKRLIFLVNDDGISVWNNTDNKTVWGLGVPVKVAQGGTGLTASPSLRVNLGSSSAASVMQASPRPGIQGVLPVAYGGTGATTGPLAAKKLLNTNAGANVGYVFGTNVDWSSVGYCSLSTLLSNMGIKFLSGSSGAVEITAGSTYKDVTITFSSAFSKTPMILLQTFTETGTQSNVPIPVLRACSKTGFTARVWRPAGASTSGGASPSFWWLALLAPGIT